MVFSDDIYKIVYLYYILHIHNTLLSEVSYARVEACTCDKAMLE